MHHYEACGRVACYRPASVALVDLLHVPNMAKEKERSGEWNEHVPSG